MHYLYGNSDRCQACIHCGRLHCIYIVLRIYTYYNYFIIIDFIIFFMQTCDIHLECEIGKISQKAPYVIAVGEYYGDNAQYFIVCEQAQLVESKSLLDSLIDLIATFYVFNIAYPSQLAGIFLFLHTYQPSRFSRDCPNFYCYVPLSRFTSRSSRFFVHRVPGSY